MHLFLFWFPNFSPFLWFFPIPRPHNFNIDPMGFHWFSCNPLPAPSRFFGRGFWFGGPSSDNVCTFPRLGNLIQELSPRKFSVFRLFFDDFSFSFPTRVFFCFFPPFKSSGNNPPFVQTNSPSLSPTTPLTAPYTSLLPVAPFWLGR